MSGFSGSSRFTRVRHTKGQHDSQGFWGGAFWESWGALKEARPLGESKGKNPASKIWLHPSAYPHVWLWESPSLLARDWPLGPVGRVGRWGCTRHHLRSQNNLGCNTTREMCFLVSRWTAWAECAVKHPKHKDSERTDTRTSLAHAPSHTTSSVLSPSGQMMEA